MSTAVAVRERPACCVDSNRSSVDGRTGNGASLILLLGRLIAFVPLSIDLYQPALPGIAHDLRAGDSDIQFTLSGTLAGLAIGQVLVGPLSDAVGRRKPMIIGSVLHMVASLACAVAPNVELLDAARVVQGLGASAGSVLAVAVVRDLFDGSALVSPLVGALGNAAVDVDRVRPWRGGRHLSASYFHPTE